MVATDLRAAYDKGKAHAIIVVAEGAQITVEEMVQYFKVHRERLGFEVRVTKLGHVQRGGSPGSFDRLLGTLFGAAATGTWPTGDTGYWWAQKRGDCHDSAG